MNKNLNEYIRGNQCTDKWLIKNNFELYNEILEYCKDINYLSFKQKLWHYQNNKPYIILCANNTCNNVVKFKGRWTVGYSTYCCQKCSVDNVEHKKSLLNYSRQSKLSKEERDHLLLIKENKLNIQLTKIENNKTIKENKLLFYNTISIDEYKKISNILNGIYSRESFLIKNMPHIYKLINDYSKNDISFNEKVYRFINNITENIKCSNCDNNTIFKNRTIGYQKYCSIECSSIDTYVLSKQTYLQNTGFTHHSLDPINIKKRHDLKIQNIKDTICNAVLLDFNNDLLKIKCDKCDNIHETNYYVYRQRIQLDLDWRDCVTHSYSTSNPEKELVEFIKSIYNNEIILNDRKVLHGKELDIYLPELNIAFEFNGIYYHSEIFKDSSYHHNKWKMCHDKGITLIQIYEDEWKYKEDIVKSRICTILNKNSIIYARKCTVKPIDFATTKLFLNMYHLQSSINSSINYGLYDQNDILVSVMTFGKPRKGLKYKTTENVYELYRFCTMSGLTIIGGASKLFNYFIKNNTFDEVFSYSALEWSGKVYEKIGMHLKSISKFSYWYIDKGYRLSRHNFTKEKLIEKGYDSTKSSKEILKELKIYRIYGPGNKTFTYRNAK